MLVLRKYMPQLLEVGNRTIKLYAETDKGKELLNIPIPDQP
jgi:hypothetical protein